MGEAVFLFYFRPVSRRSQALAESVESGHGAFLFKGGVVANKKLDPVGLLERRLAWFFASLGGARSWALDTSRLAVELKSAESGQLQTGLVQMRRFVDRASRILAAIEKERKRPK